MFPFFFFSIIMYFQDKKEEEKKKLLEIAWAHAIKNPNNKMEIKWVSSSSPGGRNLRPLYTSDLHGERERAS